MAKTNNNEITINETLLNDSKVVVGKWNDRVKKENRQFKSDLKVDGLWYLIGKLMNDLTELHGSVSEEIAKKYGFNKVASRQRRHEAKIVFQNYDLATKILRKSKRGINSISYLFQQLDAEMNPKTVSKDTVNESKVGQKEQPNLVAKMSKELADELESNQVKSIGTVTVNKEQLTERMLAEEVAFKIYENKLDTPTFAKILKESLDLLKSAS
jgi:hypothetical protein